MGRTIGVLLRLLLGLSLLGAAAAQQQSGVTNPPKVLVISREFLKPGHAGAMHEKTESAFVQAMARANWPSHYLAMDSLSGKLRSIFAISYDSLASWVNDNRAITQNATLSNAVEQAALADVNQLD